MKILYIGNDSHGAELTAFALQSIAPGVAVAWIPSLKAARGWIEENQDLAVLTVEVNPDPAACALFIRQIRGLGVTAPLVLVAGGSVLPAPPALEALADATLPKNASLLHDLPTTIGRLLKDRPSPAPPEPSPAPAVRSAPQPLPPKAPAESPRSNPFAHLVPAPGAVEQQLRQALAALEQAHQGREALTAINVELERRAADATVAFERAESRHAAEMREAAARLGDERAHANERSSQASAALDALRAELVEQAAALHKAEQQAAVDRHTAAEDAARRQARAEADLVRETSTRQAAERAAAAAETAHAAAEERHASELEVLTAGLADQKQQAEQRVAEAAARLDEQQRQANERSAQAAAALDAAATRQAAFEAERKQWEARQDALTTELADADARLAETAAAAAHRLTRDAEALEALRSELAAVTAQGSIDRQAAIEATAAHQVAVAQLQAKLVEATDALTRAGQQAESERQASTAAAAEREAAVAAERKQFHAKHDALMKELAAVTTQASNDRQAATEAATTHQATVERQTVELAAAEAARATAAQQQASELEALTAKLANQKHQFELRLVQAADALDALRSELTAELARAEAARADTNTQHASELEALTARHADQTQQFEQRLVEAAAAFETLRSELGAVTAQASTDRQAATGAATASQAAFAQLQATLAETTDALTRAEHQAESERQASAAAAAKREAVVDAERKQFDARQAALIEELADADAKQSETAAAAEHRHARDAEALEAVRAELASAKEREARLGERLLDESARRETSEHELVEARAAAEQAQRRFVDASNDMRERAREHALHLEERTARERAEWEGTLAERQERVAQLQRDGDLVRQSLASREADLKRLQTSHDEQRGRSDRARRAADADLARVREECAALQETIEVHRRQFDASPVSLCRCAPDGTVTQASRALAKLLGYASSEPLVNGGVAVFDSGDELQWLIDRCLSSRSAQSIETTWRKKDGSRIVVRLVAAASSAGCIDLAAEDITHVKALEEKLRHAQRLEAVARYASEVAGTCENLLRDVEQAGPQWLALIENTSTRHQGERLLADVVRVSGFLRQLAEYGGKQKQAVPFADVNSVLRDLTSVLKRVAGENIEVELVQPKGSKPLNLDVETEHVERVFVNIAAYARARMPLGGRLLIEVAPVLVDREFSEKYPSVRPGDHVLFTVTEVKGTALPTAAGLLGANGPDGHTPGVDLGMLQSLVANCGGHLWIAAEPSGDMILKIHLPRRALDDRAATSGPARWISRLAAVTRH